jgi:hypothetical protein
LACLGGRTICAMRGERQPRSSARTQCCTPHAAVGHMWEP